MINTQVPVRYVGTHCSGRSSLASRPAQAPLPSVARDCEPSGEQYPGEAENQVPDVAIESILRVLDRNDPRRTDYLRSRWQQGQTCFKHAYDPLEAHQRAAQSSRPLSTHLKECPVKQESAHQALEMFTSVSNADVPDAVRKMVEESVAKGRQTYEDMSALASKNSDAWREIRLVAEAGAQDIQAKLVDNSAKNIEAAFEAANAVARAKTVADMFQLQANFTQQQFAVLADQSRELLDLSVNVATRTADSINQATACMLDNVKRFE